MGKNNNLHDFLVDVADAIREKKGTSEPINPQEFSNEIRTIASGGNGWTGHADVEGLKAIGWDDEDIAYYQKYGVNWNEEDDQYHLVSDDNKALYGVLTADNIQTYRDRIVYLPKIDTSGRTAALTLFQNCVNMVFMPMIDTTQVIYMNNMFEYCASLVSVPRFSMAKATSIDNLFKGCSSLCYIPPFDMQNITSAAAAFRDCSSLTAVPYINLVNVRNQNMLFYYSNCIQTILGLDATKCTTMTNAFTTKSLRYLYIKKLGVNLNIGTTSLLEKESLLYIIENEAATEAITITLHSYAYSRLAEDADVVAALANHPLISLASA